jgi:hypothetical protein
MNVSLAKSSLQENTKMVKIPEDDAVEGSELVVEKLRSSRPPPGVNVKTRPSAPQTWEIVDTMTSGDRPTRYIDTPFSSLKAALHERNELLKYFPAHSSWRQRLCVRDPNGVLHNPDRKG